MNTPERSALPIPRPLAQAEARRVVAWAKRQDTDNAGHWDIEYNAVGTPSDSAKAPFLWDLPFDDDWDNPTVLDQSGEVHPESFQFNTPAPGFVTVDRVQPSICQNPLDPRMVCHPNWAKKGIFSRRDETLLPKYGFTFEVAVKILPHSDPQAFFLTYVNHNGVVTVELSPDEILWGSTVDPSSYDPNPVGRKKFNTTNAFHTYRIVVPPDLTVYDSSAAAATPYSLFVDGHLVGQGKMGTAYRAGVQTGFPYVLLGGNKSTTQDLEGKAIEHRNAAFVLSQARYRRGAFKLTDELSLCNRRNPPSPLPVAAHLAMNDLLNSSTLMVPDPDGVPSPSNPACFNKFCLRGPNGRRIDIPNLGTVWDFDSNKTYFYAQNLPGLRSGGDLAIEMRFRILPEADDQAFTLMHTDSIGSVSLTFSPGKLESFQGTKPAGFQTHKVDLTDRFHTIRLVRKANELYAQVYLDGNEVPVLMDQHLEGTMLDASLLQLGNLKVPRVESNLKLRMQIQYLKVGAQALAPAL